MNLIAFRSILRCKYVTQGSILLQWILRLMFGWILDELLFCNNSFSWLSYHFQRLQQVLFWYTQWWLRVQLPVVLYIQHLLYLLVYLILYIVFGISLLLKNILKMQDFLRFVPFYCRIFIWVNLFFLCCYFLWFFGWNLFRLFLLKFLLMQKFGFRYGLFQWLLGCDIW